MALLDAKFLARLKEAQEVIVIVGRERNSLSMCDRWRGFTHDHFSSSDAARDPVLCWRYVSYIRDILAAFKSCTIAALVAFQERARAQGKRVTFVAHSADGALVRAGAEGVIELAGSAYAGVCTAPACRARTMVEDASLAATLGDCGPDAAPEAGTAVTVEELPKCGKCSALLLPEIVVYDPARATAAFVAAHQAARRATAAVTVWCSTLDDSVAGLLHAMTPVHGRCALVIGDEALRKEHMAVCDSKLSPDGPITINALLAPSGRG